MTTLKAFLFTLLLILITGFLQIGLTSTLILFDNYYEFNSIHNAIVLIISYLTAYLLIFKVFWKEKLKLKETLNFGHIEDDILLYIVLIIIGLHLFDKPFWDINNIYDYFINSKIKPSAKNSDGFSVYHSIRLVSILIVSPIFEELFFRKFLLQKLFEKYSLKISIIISSILFSLIHWETLNNLIPTFLFGIISGVIFMKTKRIAYSILMHFLFNLIIQLLYISDFSLDFYLDNLQFNSAYWLISLFGGLLTSFGVYKILRKTSNH